MSEVAIVNSALSKIGENPIVSLTEGSRQANAANQQYEILRDDLLRSHQWSFATRRKQLARSARTPSHEFDFQYPVPSDFLRVVKVSASDLGAGQVKYKMAFDEDDGRVILTDATELWITYIAKVTDTGEMPPDFREALAYKLAIELAMVVAQSSSLSQLMKQGYHEALLAAKSVEGIEDYPDERPLGSWVTARHGGGW